MSLSKPVLAIDAGGVLVKKNKGGDQTDEARYPIEGAKEGLTMLKEKYELVLVSFAGKKTAALNALDMERFYPGLLDRQFYCKDKLEKIALCKALGAVAMIDDTTEVLDAIKSGIYLGKAKAIAGLPDIKCIFFTGDLEDKTAHPTFPTASTWEEVTDLCCNLTTPIEPDRSVNISKYVYGDLCVPPLEK